MNTAKTVFTPKACMILGLIGVLCVFSLPSPFSASSSTTSLHVSYPLPPALDTSWRLTFDDEFNGPGVNWKVWRDGGQNWGSGGNGEEQAYLPGMCQVAHGRLQLQADAFPANGKRYRSCMLNTMGTFQQTYGYFELRGKIPGGRGFWPAFWLYEVAIGGAPEIDVMENLGNAPTTYYMTYHSDAGQQQQTYHGVDLTAAYHTYAVKWIPGSITFYFDDIPLFSSIKDVYTGPMFLFVFVNLAVGGIWPGSPDASTHFPAYFEVDYIRGYAPS